jgi:hypothetical protein
VRVTARITSRSELHLAHVAAWISHVHLRNPGADTAPSARSVAVWFSRGIISRA